MALIGRLGTQKDKKTGLTGRLASVSDVVKTPKTIATVNGKPSLAMKPLQREQTISQAPEVKWPGGFVGAAAKAAYDTAKYTIQDAGDKLAEMTKTLAASKKPTPEELANPLRPDYLKKQSTPLERGTAIARAGVSTSNIGFLPVTTQIEAAKQIPVIKYPAEAASYLFEKAGQLGSFTLSKGVDVLPVSQQTKDTIKPLSEEVGALVSQALFTHYGVKAGQKGIDIKKLPIKPEFKEKIKTGTQLLAGVSMTPFSTAYGLANSRIAHKVAEKQASGIEVTPEIGKQIVDEVKQEIATQGLPDIQPDGSIKPQEVHTVSKAPETTNVPITVEITPEAPIKEVVTKPAGTKKFESSVFKRMKEEKPFSLADEGKLDYESINLKKEAEKAVSLVEKDKNKAYKIAIGAERSKDVTSTSVNIALSEKALSEGNFDLYAKLIKSRSLEQTRRGQEIVSERGSISDNSTATYVKKLIASRLDKLGDRYLSGIKELSGKKTTSKTKATKILDNEIAKAQSKIKNKELDIKEAQSIIDKLSC